MGLGSGKSSSLFSGFMTLKNPQTYLVHKVLANLRDLNGPCLRLTARLTKMDRGINASSRSCWIFVFLFWALSSPSSPASRSLEARMNRNIAFPNMISIMPTRPNYTSVLRGPKAVFLPRGLESCSCLSIHHFHNVLLSNGLPSSSSRKVIASPLYHLRLCCRLRNSEASVQSTQWKMK